MTGIYKITINDYYIYIGQSVDIENRWNGHLSELKQNKHCNKKLQSVFNKYPDSIKFEIIEECDVEKLDDKEMFYIEQFKSFNTKHGLNMSIGGDRGNRKYRTREEAEAANKENQKQWYQYNKDYFKQYNRQRYIDNRDRCRDYNKQYHQDNREKFKQWYQAHKEYCKQHNKQYRRQKGILSWKEKFEKRYNLSRPLTNEEWNIWLTDKSISGNHDKLHANKFLNTLPNLIFTVPSKNHLSNDK